MELATTAKLRPSRWMEDANSRSGDAFASRTLRRVIMPGSHNAGTDKLTLGIAGHVPSIYKAVPRFIRNWSVCQSIPIKDQLLAGVRYIDIRTARTRRGDYVHVHANIGKSVDESLRNIRDFVRETTHEVVIVDFQHFYNFERAHHEVYASKIKEILGATMIADAATSRATLEHIWSLNRRIVVLYGHSMAAELGFIDRPSAICSPWAGNGKLLNASSRRTFKKVLESYMDASTNDKLFVLQCVSGPSTGMIVRSLATGALAMNIRTTAQTLLKKDLPSWLQEWTHDEKRLNTLNIILLDFISSKGACGDLIDAIIRLNV